MSYDSSDPEQPQERFHYDDGVAVQEWNLNSTQHPRAVAGNPNLPPSRPGSVISLHSIPDRLHRQQGNRSVEQYPQLPRGHWEYVSGQAHAGEYAQDFNSSRSSQPSSSSGEGLQMGMHPGRSRGRGGTSRGGRGGGGPSAFTPQQQPQVPGQGRPSNRASERHIPYQEPHTQQQQRQQVIHTQPGLEPPMMPDPVVMRDRDVSPAPPGYSSGRPRPLQGQGSGHERRRRRSGNSRTRSRRRRGSESAGDRCC